MFQLAVENAVEGCVRETFGAVVAAFQAARATKAAASPEAGMTYDIAHGTFAGGWAYKQVTRPLGVGMLLGGSIDPAGEVDTFALLLPFTGDLELRSFDGGGPGSCAGIDTRLTLLAPDGSTVLVDRDQGGLESCAAIDPAAPSGKSARHLAPGTYFVQLGFSLRGPLDVPALVDCFQQVVDRNPILRSAFGACAGSPTPAASLAAAPPLGPGSWWCPAAAASPRPAAVDDGPQAASRAGRGLDGGPADPLPARRSRPH